MLTSSGRSSGLATSVRGAILRTAKLRSDKRIILFAKLAIGLLVLLTVSRHAAKTWQDMRASGGTIRVDPKWIALGILLYIAGLFVYGIYFWRVLRDSPTPVGVLPAMRAYAISHLGKYMPGKALVVVMRVGLVVPYRAGTVTAAFATLYETLVMMASGGLIAAVGFIVAPTEPWRNLYGADFEAALRGAWPMLLSAGLGVALLGVVLPPIFPRISRMISAPLRGVDASAFPRMSNRLLLSGIGWSSLGWCLLGLSQVAVVWAVSPAGIAAERWPMVIGSVALATVAGFVVAVLPGGLGVREGVLMATLAPAVGKDTAVLAALMLRLTWVAGECLAALVLYFVRPPVPSLPMSLPLPEAPAS
ncbi:lysylphosphatidylglycerol synthase transmembrane domain-containing protein [Singulisphaera sp. PoT]|uniref:lysylphosphatidylglycerol synthase transmembrane domain-containing protein n=1 Tax=Singulisphaera sp. PoT TaxID=3411797 RepID=UPI003BF46AB9